MLSILIAILIFSLIIFIHELGHFLVAKFHKVNVLEFGIGLPPRIWGKKIGTTVYSINALPFGGFVKMHGQDDFDPEQGMKVSEEDKGHFENKSSFARAQIIVAGVLMNMLLGIALMWGAYTVGTKPIFEDTEAFQRASSLVGIEVSEVMPGTPAETAKLVKGDIIKSINNEPYTEGEKLREFIGQHPNETLTFGIERKVNDAPQTLEVPITVSNEGTIGIGMYTLYKINDVSYPFLEAWRPALTDVYKISEITMKGLGMFVVSLSQKFAVPEDVAGPIGIVKITSEVTQFGFVALLQFTAILSISIGLINILPIPALDGGRLLFIVYEFIFRRKPNKRIEGKIHFAGLMILLGLIIIVSFNDILRLFVKG